MKEKKMYFNKYEFDRAKHIASIDPFVGIEAYKNYIEKYPYDSLTHLYYISLLIKVGNLSEAEEHLNRIKAFYLTNPIYKKEEEKSKIVKRNIHYCTLKLLGYQNKVAELLRYYYDKFDEIRDIGPEVCFYYENLAGIDYSDKRDSKSYLYRQIIEYNEDEFKSHLKKHLAEYNANDSSYSKNIFCPEFPIDEEIEEVKKNIPSDKRLNSGFFENEYVFKYDECGRDNNKLVDYFIVIVLNDSCKFITMCPSRGYEHYPYVDLNYIKEKKDLDSKPKVLSRIDRFNQRYKRNI